ncbi:MAG: hypothetical protein JWP49_1388 [Phenylobacterium sp.]|jgi:hypothetical protein|nr:hypothetical protein [Phenylobacterium sp.]
MTHLSAFDGLLGFATLHPLFTFGPLLLASVFAVAAARRRPAPQPVRGRS